MDARWGVVAASAAAVGAGVIVAVTGRRASTLLGMIEDPRLPDEKLATERIFGKLRPPNAPHCATVLIRKTIDGIEYRVQANRASRRTQKPSRYWYAAVRYDDTRGQQGPARHTGSFMLDYASTTSERIAQGWIAAIEEAK